MTRDSVILKILPLLSMLLAAFLSTVTDPADYNLSPVALRWIGLIATLIGVVSAWMATSWLPGKNDVDKVNRKGPFEVPMILIASALSGALLSGCAALHTPAPATLPSAPAALAKSADEDVHAVAIKALVILQATGALIEKVVDVELTLQPTLPAAFHQKFKVAAIALSKQAIEMIDQIERGVIVTWAQFKMLADPVIASAGSLVDLVRGLPSATSARSGFRGLVEMLSQIAGSVFPFRAPVPEGAL